MKEGKGLRDAEARRAAAHKLIRGAPPPRTGTPRRGCISTAARPSWVGWTVSTPASGSICRSTPRTCGSSARENGRFKKDRSMVGRSFVPVGWHQRLRSTPGSRSSARPFGIRDGHEMPGTAGNDGVKTAASYRPECRADRRLRARRGVAAVCFQTAGCSGSTSGSAWSTSRRRATRSRVTRNVAAALHATFTSGPGPGYYEPAGGRALDGGQGG